MKFNISKIFLILFSLLFIGASCSVTPGGDSGPNTSGPAGVFVTTNNGEKWNQLSKLPTASGVQNIENTSVYKLIKDPQDPDALYWASRGSGLYYSYNQGKTWQKDEGPLQNKFVYALAIHPDDKCTIFASDGFNVYRTTDCTRSWEQVYKEDRSNARINTLAFQQSEPYKLFMGKKNGDLLVTTNFGTSWNVMKRFEMTIQNMYTDKQHEDMIYIASKESGLYRSSNLGESWVNLKKTMNDFAQALDFHRASVFPGGSDKIFWASKYGILVSDDKGDSWESLGLITSPGSADIWGLAIDPKNDNNIYYTATVKNKSTFYFSKDGGDSWSTKELPTGQWPVSLRVHDENTDIIYAGFMKPKQD
ncbi:MAG: WD40/YVTN/BNR-like repeat-containing protein [Candidatus Magasanikbacteria bacterium]